MKRLVKSYLLALLALLITGTIVYAAIASPAPYAVYQTNVYRNGVEADDQTWIITGIIEYGTNPTEDAQEIFVIRILDSDSNEVKATTPYSAAYNDSGYAEFCAGIYFAADDADLPTWSANYSVQLTGNPALDWTAGDPPATSNPVISSWSEASAMATRIRSIAAALETDWGANVIEPSQAGTTQLTATGEDYFETSIANLRAISPDLFSSVVTVPEFEARTYTQAEATTVETRWIGDSLLDFTDVADAFGVSRMWMTAVLWIVFSMLICGFAIQRVLSYKMGAFLLAILLAVGAMIGLMPFVVAPVMGLLCIVGFVYTVAWSSGT